MKEKARKLAGIPANKRIQYIEDHHDDCGSDLSGLGPDIVLLASDSFHTSTPGVGDGPGRDDEVDPNAFTIGLSTRFMFGSDFNAIPSTPSSFSYAVHVIYQFV